MQKLMALLSDPKDTSYDEVYRELSFELSAFACDDMKTQDRFDVLYSIGLTFGLIESIRYMGFDLNYWLDELVALEYCKDDRSYSKLLKELSNAQWTLAVG